MSCGVTGAIVGGVDGTMTGVVIGGSEGFIRETGCLDRSRNIEFGTAGAMCLEMSSKPRPIGAVAGGTDTDTGGGGGGGGGGGAVLRCCTDRGTASVVRIIGVGTVAGSTCLGRGGVVDR